MFPSTKMTSAIDERVKSFVDYNFTDDWAFGYLSDNKEDIDEDGWGDVGLSDDFSYFFEERYYDRYPCGQPDITCAEWAVCELAACAVSKANIHEWCEVVAETLEVDPIHVHTAMMGHLRSLFVDTAYTIC